MDENTFCLQDTEVALWHIEGNKADFIVAIHELFIDAKLIN